MREIRFQVLVSKRNLKLAWHRMTTGVNQQYKRFFRRLYYAYELALEENIEDLHARLRGGAFEPSPPIRVYIPKPSGLQRPLTLLLLEDQILLQSIANLYAEKVKSRRRSVELKSVFSNILQPSEESIFFFKDWHYTYGKFQKQIEKYYENGLRWIAQFDLAAFYDTISHDLLLRTLFPRGGGSEVSEPVSNWLRAWSAEKKLQTYKHGIPQGPVASDFLAECFLLPVDEALSEEGITYVRYVDDIRLFGIKENEVRKAALRLEVLCRDKGLIPEGKKFGIFKAKSLKEAMGVLPSLAPPGQEGGEDFFLPRKTALNVFRKALQGKPLGIIDKSRARYVLYRAEPCKELLAYVLRLLPRHPEHIDAFVHYLDNYKKSRSIVTSCMLLLRSTPYEYVEGEMWHVLARMLPETQVRDLIQEAVNVAKSKDTCISAKWGSLHFLCIADCAGHGRYANFVGYQEALLQALLAPVLPERVFRSDGVVKQMFERTACEPGIMLAEEFVKRGLDYRSFVGSEVELKSQVRNVFRAVGLISDSRSPVEPIGEIIARRYKLQAWNGWRPLLGQDYTHAQQILCHGDALFDSGRSVWLAHQNSFNDAVFVAIQKYLSRGNLPGKMRLVGRDGKRVSFGVLLAKRAPFDQTYPVITEGFREMNDRRNRLPGSHPYAESGLRTRFLTKNEQNQLIARLKVAYQEVINNFN
jgi:hypothetical protein